MQYKIIIRPDAQKDLTKIDNNLRIMFFKHFSKLSENFHPAKHLNHGLPYFVEKVTDSARFPFSINNDTIYILRCFKNHKEYEKWYKN